MVRIALVRSQLHVAKCFPFGLNARLRTRA